MSTDQFAETVSAVTVRKATPGTVNIGYEERAAPRPGPGDLVIAPSFVGICGSDLELVAGHSDDDFPTAYPVVLGHEWSGVVLAVGAETGSGFALGQLVVGHGSLGNNHWFGITDDGAMAERFVVPSAMCFAVPEGVSAQRAAMVEPLACALRGLQSAGGADASHTAVVFGCGTLGLAMIGLLVSTGAKVVAIDPSEQRRNIAERLGATVSLPAADGAQLLEEIRLRLDVTGADLVVEASGNPAAQAAALEVTAVGARVLLMGLAHGNTTAALRLVQARLLTVVTSVGAPAAIWEPTLRLLARTGMDLTPAVSDVFGFDRCHEALTAARHPDTTGKVMLAPVG
jgi:L-iditol 2-dehydrogenase